MTQPEPGQFVKLRHRFGRVVNVAPHHGDHQGVTSLVEVSYLDTWSHPESDQVVWHLEEHTGAKILSSLTLPNPIEGKGDDPADLEAMVDACRWTALDRLPDWNPDPLVRAQHAPLTGVWHSAVEPEDYQLIPVLKALAMPRVTLLLADDVGLGKTIEAGLALSEMFNRRRIRRVLVMCPAGLQQQWQEELHDKFHLDFDIMDSRMVDRLRKEEGFDTNPWMVHPRLITSMDFLKQEGIKDQFMEASSRFSQEGQSLFPGFDLLIVDEAHNLAPNALGDDSQRTQLLRDLLPCFEHRLFLTATPHNGHTRTFTGLLELLDPVRFHQDDTFPVAAQQQLQLVMVRRLKKDINAQCLEPRFKDRRIEAIQLPVYGPKEARLWTALRAYREGGLAILGRLGRREQHVGRFLFTLLTKRALSSSYAFARTWWSHMEGLENHAKVQSLREEAALQEARAAQRQAEREADNEATRNLWEQEALLKGARWLATVAKDLLVPAGEVSEALEALGWTRARTARALDENGAAKPMVWPHAWPEDARWTALKSWIAQHLLTPAGEWTEERLILFTEYRDTLDYLRARMDAEGQQAPRVEELHGASDAKERDRIKKLFNNPQADLRIMVATDAASEGLNFQESCRFVIHQELPWSPTKLEQRNGRVDRHGQFRDVVAHHFVSDQDEDLAFLDLLARKVHTVREELGSAGQVLDAAVTQHFLGEKRTAKGLLDAVEGRVAASTARADLQGADHGSKEVLERTRRQLKGMERQMGWSPERVRRLLERAVRSQGHVAAVAHRPGHFTFQEPKAWEDLVKTSLLDDRGNRPYLVFDPATFEQRINGLRTFRNEPDALLLRLGHPVLRRAVHEVLGRVHEDSTHRWSLGSAELPPGVEAVLVLHAELRAQNDLREHLHHEILSIPFQWAGDRLLPMDAREWDPFASKPLQALPHDRGVAVHARLNQVWTRLEPTLAQALKLIEADHQKLLAERAKVWKTELTAEGKAQFEARLKEIADNLSEKGLKRLEEKILADQKELLAARQQSQSLFEDLELERQEQLLSLEDSLVAREQRVAFLEQRKAELMALQDQLKLAQDRWLTKILPRRYAIPPGGLSVLPLAFEVRVGG
jgi:superfamily II DNA or RNA helicase